MGRGWCVVPNKSRVLPNLCTADSTVPKVRQKRRNNGRDGVRDELEGGSGVEGVGACYMEGGGVFSRVMLGGRRAARKAGCYGLFSPGVGVTWTRCALPSAPASMWFIAALADASVHGEVWKYWECVCVVYSEYVLDCAWPRLCVAFLRICVCACEFMCAFTCVHVHEHFIGCWFLTCGWRMFKHGPTEDTCLGYSD